MPLESRGSIIRSAAYNQPPPPDSTGPPKHPRRMSRKQSSESNISTVVPTHSGSGSGFNRSSTHGGGGGSSVHVNRTSVHGQSTRSNKLKRMVSIDSTSDRERERDKLYQQRKADEEQRQREEKRAILEEEIRHEKLTMFIFSCICLICGILWLVALSIDYWYMVYGNPNLESNDKNKTGRFVYSRSGLWKVCRTVTGEKEDETSCKSHSMFPDKDEIKRDEGIDQHVIDYQRTQISFAIVSILLIPMAGFASFYTFKNSRYTYKRLASCLYFLLAITVLVVIEVVITSVSYEKVSVPYNHPKNSSFSYGFCFYTGWTVFLVYLVTAALFLAYSRKRKRDAALDDEDEDIII